LIVVYLGGVVASVVLGLDLMIKNERYLLVIMSPVAILAAFGVTSAIRMITGFRTIGHAVLLDSRSITLTMSLLGAGISIVLVPMVPMVAIPIGKMLVRPVSVPAATQLSQSKASRERDRVSSYAPMLGVAKWLSESTARDTVVLSMRPSDLYYADRRMVSYLDPRLLEFYRQNDPVQGAAILARMGVSVIHLSDYFIPPISHSSLMQILADPNLATLQYDSYGVQVYQLAKSGKFLDQGFDYASASGLWLETLVFFMPIPMDRLVSGTFARSLPLADSGDRTNPIGPLHRAFGTWLTPSGSTKFPDLRINSIVPVSPGTEYLLDIEFDGCGYFSVWIVEYGQDGQIVTSGGRGSTRLMDLAACGSSLANFKRRFQTNGKAQFVRVGIEHRGYSWVSVKKFALVSIR